MYSAISEYDSSYCSTYTNNAKERKPYDQFSGWSALRNIDEGHVVQCGYYSFFALLRCALDATAIIR